MPPKAGKQDLLEKINSCESRILGLEKQIITNLYTRNNKHRVLYSNVEQLDSKYKSDRKTFKRSLQQDIKRMRDSVDAFHKMLVGMKPDPSFVEKLKQTMESIETSIMAFKERQRESYEALLQEEQTTTQEVNAFDRKLESWLCIAAAPHITPEAAASGNSQDPVSTMPPAIIAFERFLQQTGGRQGGWDDYDHKTFLKTRANHSSGGAGFLEAAAAELPTKTVEEIEQHEQWYIEYCTLLASKKKAIEEWKEEKQKGRVREVKLTPVIARVTQREEMLEKEKKARFAKLDEWKAEQRRKQQIREEEMKRQKEKQEAAEREQENTRRALLKGRVEEYAREKEAKLSEQRAKEEAKTAQELADRKLANKEIEKFRARDMSAIEARKKKAEAKEVEKLEKEKRLESLKEQVPVKAQRDPSRLYKLTKGWEERKKATLEPGEGGAAVGASLPKRAVPTWRQGV